MNITLLNFHPFITENYQHSYKLVLRAYTCIYMHMHTHRIQSVRCIQALTKDVINNTCTLSVNSSYTCCKDVICGRPKCRPIQRMCKNYNKTPMVCYRLEKTSLKCFTY